MWTQVFLNIGRQVLRHILTYSFPHPIFICHFVCVVVQATVLGGSVVALSPDFPLPTANRLAITVVIFCRQ